MFETTEQVFEMLHGAAIDALERMEAERDMMRTRAETAEAEVGRLRAELATMPRPEDRCHGEWPCEASTALASAEAEVARAEASAEAAEAEADSLRAELAQARAEGEAAGYRRAIDEACALLDEEQLRAWAVSVSPRNDGFANGVRHAMFEVRALAPVEPVSSADGLLGTAP